MLNSKMTETVKIYNQRADSFFKDYEGVSSFNIHKNWLNSIASFNGLALDIGAGSGRDSAYLAERGFNVVAVEPSDRLRSLAQQKHISKKIQWISDCLPRLLKVEELNVKFNLILLSAVWMHIAPPMRQLAFANMVKLMKKNAHLIMTLRRGTSPDERIMYDVSAEEVIELSNEQSLTLVHQSKDKDALKRGDVWWETIVLKTDA